jgi:hypothetical protein
MKARFRATMKIGIEIETKSFRRIVLPAQGFLMVSALFVPIKLCSLAIVNFSFSISGAWDFASFSAAAASASRCAVMAAHAAEGYLARRTAGREYDTGAIRHSVGGKVAINTTIAGALQSQKSRSWGTHSVICRA